MANIYINCGDYDKALGELEELLSLQGSYTVHNIELNAHLNPLRHLPRYRQIIQKYSVPL